MTAGRRLPGELRIAVPADPRVVPQVRSAVTAFCRGGGWRGRAVEEVGLALTEVCNNALEHGNAGGPGLRVLLGLEPDRIVLRVIGGGADKAVNLRRALGSSGGLPREDDERGRGLFLVRACMDDVKVRTVRGQTEVRLIKERRSAR